MQLPRSKSLRTVVPQHGARPSYLPCGYRVCRRSFGWTRLRRHCRCSGHSERARLHNAATGHRFTTERDFALSANPSSRVRPLLKQRLRICKLRCRCFQVRPKVTIIWHVQGSRVLRPGASPSPGLEQTRVSAAASCTLPRLRTRWSGNVWPPHARPNSARGSRPSSLKPPSSVDRKLPVAQQLDPSLYAE
jgi:hypothetical protein